MGRPSKLSDLKWEELGARIAAGGKPADLAKEYGVSTGSISKRMTGKHKSASTELAPIAPPPDPTVPEKRAPGRESTFSQDIADEICDRLAKGEPLASICRSDNMPAVRTVSDWRAAHEDFAAAFVCARDEGYDVIAADTLEIIDTIPERQMTAEGSKVDTGHVAWLKNRAEQRLKLLAKWDPRRYGEKMAIGGASDLPPVQSAVLNVNLPADPQEASKKYQEIMGG